MPSGPGARRLMRAFLAVHPTARFTRALTTGLDPARSGIALKWVAPVNWHVTLQFLGDWPTERLEGLKEALAGRPPGPSFTLRSGAVGVFPDWRRPRVLFLHLDSDGQLETLAAAVRRVTAGLWPDGPQDTRPLKSHLTLGRLKAPLSDVERQMLQGMDLGALPEVPVEGVALMGSRLTPRGPVYTELGYFGLA